MYGQKYRPKLVKRRSESHFGSSHLLLSRSVGGCSVWYSLLHPCETTCHASQRMVFPRDSRRMVPSDPRATSQGSARATAVVFFLVAVWAVACCEVREAPGSTEMATRAGSTRHASRHNPDEVLAAARNKVQRLERAIEVLGDNDSVEARWLTSALQEARRAAQERPTAIQVEECQAFIQRSQNRLLKMEQERVAEQKELDAALVRLTRLREEMSRVPAPGPTQPASVQPVPPDSTLAELQQLRARVAEMETEREELRKKRGRSLSVPSPDMPGALEQNIALFQHPGRDRSSLMATLIDRGGTIAGSSNRFNPLA